MLFELVHFFDRHKRAMCVGSEHYGGAALLQVTLTDGRFLRVTSGGLETGRAPVSNPSSVSVVAGDTRFWDRADLQVRTHIAATLRVLRCFDADSMALNDTVAHWMEQWPA